MADAHYYSSRLEGTSLRMMNLNIWYSAILKLCQALLKPHTLNFFLSHDSWQKFSIIVSEIFWPTLFVVNVKFGQIHGRLFDPPGDGVLLLSRVYWQLSLIIVWLDPIIATWHVSTSPVLMSESWWLRDIWSHDNCLHDIAPRCLWLFCAN